MPMPRVGEEAGAEEERAGKWWADWTVLRHDSQMS